MNNSLRMARSTLALLLLLVLGLCGCFQTTYLLVAPEQAKVNKAFVGNWNSAAFKSEGREAGLIVRNIDDKQLYVEWLPKDGELVRSVGFTSEVNGKIFLQIRGLEKDGSLEDKWLTMRLDLSGNQVMIRQLNDDFFKNQTFNSAEQLRKLLETNLENDAMYDKDVVIATKAD